MGEFFDKLLEKRGLTAAPVPLWKLDISDLEYEALKLSVLTAVCNKAFWNNGKEFALFYAEAWRREYCGGWISKEDVASYAKVPSFFAEKMFNYAKSALSSLHVPVIRQNNNQYFRTLLLQGGLPMAYVQRKDSGFNRFKQFLKSMITELSRLSVDWEDVDVVKGLSCLRYLPETYKNDNIYAVSLQIARAINEERDDLLPYKTDTVELKKLTEMLKKERERVKKLIITHPLSINWTFEVMDSECDSEGVFRYSLDSVKTIYSDMIVGLNPEECFQFDLFVSQQYVATYKKVKLETDGYGKKSAIYKRVNSDNKEFTWNGDSIIDVKLVCDTDDELFPSVINSCAPNLTIPQMLQKKGDRYVQQKDYASVECISLYRKPWRSECIDEVKDITIGGEEYRIAFFPEVSESQFIPMINMETGEEIELKNMTSKYSVVFGGVYLPWLEKSSHALLTKRLLVDVYDEGGLRSGSGRVMCRQRGSSEWTEYSDKIVRPGIVDIKVIFPDGSFDVKTFYYIDELNFEAFDAAANSARIRCNLNWGNVYAVKQENVSYTVEQTTNHSVTWNVVRTPNTLKFPSTCSFEIHNPGNPALKISIPSPYEGLCLVKNEDELVSEDTVLSFNEFSQYRILCSEGKPHSMKISYTGMIDQERPITIYQKVKGGITPLSNFEDSINRLFNVNGVNSFDRTSAAILTLGNKDYRVRYFTMDSALNVLSETIEVHSLDTGAGFVNYEGKIFACKIVEPEEDAEPSVFQLDHLDCGSFKFPNETEDGDYIVFSDVYDKHRLIPRLYHIINGHLGDEAYTVRSANKKQNIDVWISELTYYGVENEKTWGLVPQYIEIADRWRLPFRTFNAISASVSSPVLMTKLLLRLLMDDKIDALSSAILKIEQECAMAVHWNRTDIVMEQFLQVTKDYSQRQQMKFFQDFKDALHNIMTLTLDADVADLMTRFLCGNLKNVDADLLTNAEVNDFKRRAIGKNTDESNFNSDLPILHLNLVHSYYSAAIQMLPYQDTLIKAPLYVYEYTQKWKDSLWGTSPERIKRRRIINFYRLHYKYTYYTILVKMLK